MLAAAEATRSLCLDFDDDAADMVNSELVSVPGVAGGEAATSIRREECSWGVLRHR